MRAAIHVSSHPRTSAPLRRCALRPCAASLSPCKPPRSPLRQPGPRGGRRHGHDAVRPRRVPQRLLRRAQPAPARAGREIHREYLRAGAEVLETNTFGANPLKLASYGLADDTERINRRPRGWRARPPALVLLWPAPWGRWASGSSPSASCRWTRPGVSTAAGARAPDRRGGRLHPRDLQRRQRAGRGAGGRSRAVATSR